MSIQVEQSYVLSNLHYPQFNQTERVLDKRRGDYNIPDGAIVTVEKIDKHIVLVKANDGTREGVHMEDLYPIRIPSNISLEWTYGTPNTSNWLNYVDVYTNQKGYTNAELLQNVKLKRKLHKPVQNHPQHAHIRLVNVVLTEVTPAMLTHCASLYSGINQTGKDIESILLQ